MGGKVLWELQYVNPSVCVWICGYVDMLARVGV